MPDSAPQDLDARRDRTADNTPDARSLPPPALVDRLGARYGWLTATGSGEIVTISERAERWLDLDASAVGRPLAECLDLFVGLEETVADIAAGRREELVLARIHWPGRDGPATLNLSVLRAASDRLTILIEDDTEMARLEQALVQERNELRLARRALAAANDALRRLDRMKSIYYAMVTHDLRGPLSLIRTYIQLLASEPALPPSLDAELSVLRAQSDWLETLIANVLDLEQLEVGQLDVHLRSADLRPAVQRIVNLLRPLAAAAELELTLVDNAPPGPLTARLDEARLTQLLHNLVGNAIKHTDPGGTISVRLGRESGALTLVVADNGRGMAAEHLPHIFELFYRTPEARQQVRGSGIGLTITRQLVTAHGGHITVDSKPGSGTSFVITLPGL